MRADIFRERVSFPYYCLPQLYFGTVVFCEDKNNGYKKRYKTMSLDVWRKAVIVATESDVKEGGYSLPNEQVE